MPFDNPRFFDIFRGLLGLQPRPVFPENYPGDSRRGPAWHEEPYQEDDDGLYENDNGQESPFHFGFNIFSGDPLQMHKFFEQQFDDMLRHFQGLSTGVGGPWEALPPPDQAPPAQVEPADPRQRYLKSPHWFDSSGHAQPPSTRADTDLDDEVREGDWSALLPSGANEEMPHHQPSASFSSSSSSYTVTSTPQGRVEERRVVKRSDGAEEVCVSRRLGDQSFTSIITTMPGGETSTTERLVNIDKVEEFEKAWSEMRVDQPQPRLGTLPSFFH